MISEIRITIVDKDNLRAMASAKIGGILIVTGMRIMNGSRGRFLAMPSRKDARGEYQDIYFPASREARDQLSVAVMTKYDEIVSADTGGEGSAQTAAPATQQNKPLTQDDIPF